VALKVAKTLRESPQRRCEAAAPGRAPWRRRDLGIGLDLGGGGWTTTRRSAMQFLALAAISARWGSRRDRLDGSSGQRSLLGGRCLANAERFSLLAIVRRSLTRRREFYTQRRWQRLSLEQARARMEASRTYSRMYHARVLNA